MFFPVSLHFYDLTSGKAKKFSKRKFGYPIDGIWFTTIVAYGKEYYYGDGISYDLPACTPYGKYTLISDINFLG